MSGRSTTLLDSDSALRFDSEPARPVLPTLGERHSGTTFLCRYSAARGQESRNAIDAIDALAAGLDRAPEAFA
jgi:hypothetical protein